MTIKHHCKGCTGFCSVFNRQTTIRDRDVCRGYDQNGSPISTTLRRKYLAKWTAAAAEAAGLGTQVAAILKAAGVKECGACTARKKTLNTIAPPSHWLSRLLKHFTPRKSQPVLQLPSLEFGRWTVNTSDVTPSQLVTIAAPQSFPVINYDQTAPKPPLPLSPQPSAVSESSSDDEAQPVPFVWIYWHTGANGDELRWSMRSVVDNFDGPVSIKLVGAKPPWFTGEWLPVHRVPDCPDRRTRDTLNKLYHACKSEDTPDEFFWIMDDVYLLQPVSFEELKKPRHYGRVNGARIENYHAGNRWQKLKGETFRELHARGKVCHEWGTHLPHWINKRKFLDIWERYDLANRPLIWELIYGAEFYDHRTAEHSRHFFKRLLYPSDCEKLTTLNHKVINNGNQAWTEPLRAFLWERFHHVDTGYDSGPVAEPRWEKLTGPQWKKPAA